MVKQDDNRYNASRGAHLNLKRAEKARILVNKIPGKSRINVTSLLKLSIVGISAGYVFEDETCKKSGLGMMQVLVVSCKKDLFDYLSSVFDFLVLPRSLRIHSCLMGSSII